MVKTETISWREFFNTPKVGECVDKGNKTQTVKSVLRVVKIASTSALIFSVVPVIAPVVMKTLGIPTASTMLVQGVNSMAIGHGALLVSASGEVANQTFQEMVTKVVEVSSTTSGWDRLISKVLWITDYLMSGIIIYSGISWMFGNRTKAIEHLFGAGVGYMIVRHHQDIKEFFQLL